MNFFFYFLVLWNSIILICLKWQEFKAMLQPHDISAFDMSDDEYIDTHTASRLNLSTLQFSRRNFLACLKIKPTALAILLLSE
jgi:hypothetical protein